MNADAKVLDRPVSSPVSGGVPGGVVQKQIGSPNKETLVATGGLPELRPAGPDTEHLISQELEDLGVKEKEEMPDLTQTPDIQHAGPHVPVPVAPSAANPITISKEKDMDVNNAKAWQDRLMEKVNKVKKLFGF